MRSSIEIFTIRPATRSDIPMILTFIKALAKYEKLLHEVEATEAQLEKHLFDDNAAEVFIGELDGIPVGFALTFRNFSTFLGKPGIYLEDLFVLPEYRGKGFGKQLLTHLAKIVVERGYGRLDWCVLDWNTPAKEFYNSLGAGRLDGWEVFRLTGDALERLAGE